MTTLENNKGSIVIEAVLVLPLLVVLFFGIIDFSVLLYNQKVLTRATREAARCGILNRPQPRSISSEDSQIVNLAQTFQTFLISWDGNPAMTVPAPVRASAIAELGTDLTVTASFTYSFLIIPLPAITLTEQAVMQME